MTFRVGRGDARTRAEAAEADELQEDTRVTDWEAPSEGVGMTAGQAFSDMLSQPFGFSGRASRSEFIFKIIWFNLLIIGPGTLLAITGALTGVLTGGVGFIPLIIFLLCAGIWAFVYGLPLQVRRLHDAGHSGWWLLGVIVAGSVIGAFDPSQIASGVLNLGFLIYLCAKPSK